MFSKKKKLILLVVGIIFILFGWHACSQSNKKEAIISVLEQDAKAGEEKSNSKKISAQTRIRLDECPKDFADAYREHQKAWREALEIETEIERFKQDYDSGSACLEAFVRGMFWDFGILGEAREAANVIEEHARRVEKNISDTFDHVLEIAEKYGVDTSKYK